MLKIFSGISSYSLSEIICFRVFAKMRILLDTRYQIKAARKVPTTTIQTDIFNHVGVPGGARDSCFFLFNVAFAYQNSSSLFRESMIRTGTCRNSIVSGCSPYVL